jgi:ABC-type nitrate/sulfonate/bicarbonate transport system substrate-binding protein
MLIAVGVSVMLVAATGCGSSGSGDAATSSDEPFTVRYGSSSVLLNTIIIAEEKGFFAQNKLIIKLESLPSSGAVSNAIAAGQIDLGNSSPPSSIIASVKGIKITTISGIENTLIDKSGRPWEGVSGLALANSGIKSPADLKGKKVGVSDVASFYAYALKADLIQRGIDPEKDVQIVPVPFPQMVGALLQKQVDAVIGLSSTLAAAKQRDPLSIWTTHTQLVGEKVGLTSTLDVNDKFLKEHRPQAVAFLKSMIQARQWMAQDVAATGGQEMEAIVAKRNKLSDEAAKVALELRDGYYGKELDFVNLLDVPKAGFDRAKQILITAGVIPKDAPLKYEDMVDVSLLKEAYQATGLTWDESKH